MDWTALFLSLKLAGWTVILLVPIGIWARRALAWRRIRGKGDRGVGHAAPDPSADGLRLLPARRLRGSFACRGGVAGGLRPSAASCCGMPPWKAFLKVELPPAWPGILTAMVLSCAHTLGEFGIVLMVDGSIPGETRTIAIAIYDRVQAFDDAAAPRMSALLLVISLTTIALTFAFSSRVGRRLS